MHTIGYVVFPGFQVMGFAPVAAFEMANLVVGREAYGIELLSENGGLVTASTGFSVATQAFGRRAFDTVMIGAAVQIEPVSRGLVRFIRHSFKTARRLAAPCTGAFVLAQSGVLDGRRATTHWLYAKDLQQAFPAVKVDDDKIFIVDGSIWTSAGMTASIDLALAMIEKDHGVAVARSVARKLVMYHRRPGGQSQFSTLLELAPKSDRIERSLAYARTHLSNILNVDELAQAASLSPRQFSRAFRAETGQTPARAVEQMRVEAARLMMEEGRHSMDVIANETGFSDRDRMRRAFLRVMGQPPQAVRRHARNGSHSIESEGA